MAPIRRYLRITKYSVLEVRIYLETPSLAETWLLRQPDPALPRIIEAVRPLVLPKLREENERSKGKGKTKKGVRDVVSQDEFEVSIFLTEHSSRHSLLTKHKQFEDKPRIKSNAGKLTGWLTTAGTRDRPVNLDEGGDVGVPIRQEDEDGVIDLEAIPAVPSVTEATRSKRHRQMRSDDLFVNEDSSDSNSADESGHQQTKRKRASAEDQNDDEDEDVGGPTDEKKKLAMNTVYDGFSIYGRILCLVVKRKGTARGSSHTVPHSSQHMMEAWVSTQAVRELGADEDD